MSRPSKPASRLEALGLPPRPGTLAELAVTHRSYAFEQEEPAHNERLEFLGDAVLGLIVTDLVFHDHPTLAEGEMARLRASVVNTLALAELARSLGLGEHIRLGKGEDSSGGRNKASLLADTFEALVGAAYLERGLQAVAADLAPLFRDALERVVATGGAHDPKTALQELVVRAAGVRPAYRVVASAADHDKRFVAEVFVGRELHGAGSGRSKKQAERNAAREALAQLGDTPRLAPAVEAPSEEAADARAS